MDNDIILNKAINLNLKEEDNVPDEFSECCKAPIKFTANSGVYICPGIYCSKCKSLII